jgi:hypothetical protein
MLGEWHGAKQVEFSEINPEVVRQFAYKASRTRIMQTTRVIQPALVLQTARITVGPGAHTPTKPVLPASRRDLRLPNRYLNHHTFIW